MASKVINYGLPHTLSPLLPSGHSGTAEDVIIGLGDVHYNEHDKPVRLGK